MNILHLLLIMVLIMLVQEAMSAPTPQEIEDYIVEQSNSDRFKINPQIMIAMAKVESTLRPSVTNYNEESGIPSRGLFQIQDSTAASFCRVRFPKSLYDYKLNTRCALLYMRHLLDRFKQDYIKAILSYNAGSVYRCTRRHHLLSKQHKDCILGVPINISYLHKVLSHL